MQWSKVLVTGGAGFIGSHLVDSLLAHGADVIVYDNFCTGRLEFLPQNSPKLKVISGDVRDLASLTKAARGCDFIFHFQANADVRGGKENAAEGIRRKSHSDKSRCLV